MTRRYSSRHLGFSIVIGSLVAVAQLAPQPSRAERVTADVESRRGVNSTASWNGPSPTPAGLDDAQYASLPIVHRVARNVLGDCRYEAVVRGNPAGRDRGETNTLQYRPLYVVDAVVDCRGRSVRSTTEQLTAAPADSDAEIAAALERRATVSIERNGRVCELRPRFTVLASTVLGHEVDTHCTPRSRSMPRLAPPGTDAR